MFPSPCGVNIVAKGICTGGNNIFIVTKFPSPCGVNIVAKPAGRPRRGRWSGRVSVPLRGKYRGEGVASASYCGPDEYCFRPLAG